MPSGALTYIAFNPGYLVRPEVTNLETRTALYTVILLEKGSIRWVLPACPTTKCSPLSQMKHRQVYRK